ncbi:glycosyltransferase family 4 protein [Candidatus Woesearchaeota archaeon]|nr:glycosyltransferase family 4 protein [Candidatus Woesearchaeota archaeon]
MKTVLVLASTFPRWKGDSTPSFVYELSNRLADNRRMIVSAPHAGNAAKYEKMGRLEVYRYAYFYPENLQKLAYGAGIITNAKSNLLALAQIPLFLLADYGAARSLAKQFKPAMVHAHWLIPQGIFAAFLKKELGIPLIATIHGSDLFPLKNRFFRSMQRFALENCEYCTVNSEATKNELLKRFPEFKSKVLVIPMGVDTKLFSKNNVKSKFNHYKNKKIILFAGRLNEQKGVEHLIKAMKLVNYKIKNALLLIIGDGNYKKELQKIADSNEVKNIKFLRAVKQDDLVDYYNLADVFVLPSVTSRIGTEGQGLVLLEAMSCGTPVIGSETGGIKFLINNNENGLLVKERNEDELANAIIRILSDSKLSQKLSRNGVQFVKDNYSWETIAKKFDKLYSKIK